MNRQEWLEWRRQGIGASDAPVIMGVCPWKTISALMEEKVFGTEDKDNADKERGRNLEPVALDLFMKKMNIDLSFQDRIIHQDIGWMRATLDGVNYDKKIIVEVKCPQKHHKKVPDHYYPQLQHQLEVTGFDLNYFVSYDGNDLRIFEVQRDQKYINRMVPLEEEFWTDVQNLNLSKYVALIDKSKDDNWREYARLYLEADGAEKKAKEAKDFAKSQLILFSEGKNVQGAGLKLTKSMVKGAIDYGLIEEIRSVDLEKYRKPAFPKYTIMPYSN